MRRLLTVLILAVGTILVGSGPAAAETIRLRADNWCPYNCAPDSPKPGYMVEIAKAVFEPKGITIDYATMAWAQAVEEARAGKHDGIIGASPEDAPEFIFTGSTLGILSNVLAARTDYAFSYTGIGSLKGHRMAAIQDYTYGGDIDAYISAGQDVELIAGENVTVRNIQKLLAGQVALVLEDRNVLEYTLSGEGLTGLVAIHQTGLALKLYIAFSPANPKSADYARMLEEGVAQLRASGQLKDILNRYGLHDWK